MKKLAIGVTLVALSLSGQIAAQTPAVVGAAATPTSWNALSDQIKATTARIATVESAVNQMKLCAQSGKMYAPGTGADMNGCKSMPLTASNDFIALNISTTTNTMNVKKVMACNNVGQVYSSTTGTCINAKSGRDCGGITFSNVCGYGTCRMRLNRTGLVNPPSVWASGEAYTFKLMEEPNTYFYVQCRDGSLFRSYSGS